MRRARLGPMKKHNYCSSLAVSVLYASALAWSVGSIMTTYAQSQEQSKISPWYSRVSKDTHTLFAAVQNGHAGKVDEQIVAATMFAQGRGSQEGAKMEAARYWLERAIDANAVQAIPMLAALYAIENPPNIEKAGEQLAKYFNRRISSKPSTERPAANPTCEASPYCRGYPTLIGGYFRLFVKYPPAARAREAEATFVAEVNFESRSIQIQGKDVPPEFVTAVTEVLDSALKALPEPPEFDKTKFKRMQIPLNFRLD